MGAVRAKDEGGENVDRESETEPRIAAEQKETAAGSAQHTGENAERHRYTENEDQHLDGEASGSLPVRDRRRQPNRGNGGRAVGRARQPPRQRERTDHGVRSLFSSDRSISTGQVAPDIELCSFEKRLLIRLTRETFSPRWN